LKRRINTPIYITAFIVTTVIFAIGFWLGTIYDGLVSEGIEHRISDVSSNAMSLQLFFLMDDSSEFCGFYSSELEKVDHEAELLGYQLSYLEEHRGFANPALKDKYFILEYTSMVMSRKVRETCGGDYSMVMYFYSNELCGDDCVLQGRELLKVKELLGEKVRIYSFDCTIGSPIADSLCSASSIGRYPSIVINGNGEKLEGLHGSDKVISKIRG